MLVTGTAAPSRNRPGADAARRSNTLGAGGSTVGCVAGSANGLRVCAGPLAAMMACSSGVGAVLTGMRRAGAAGSMLRMSLKDATLAGGSTAAMSANEASRGAWSAPSSNPAMSSNAATGI
jgi:hypothetical protein